MKHRFGIHTSITLVVGSMIGTGVFVSLGYQLVEFHSGFAIASLWILGGICALCGAVCYSELASALPRSGGEYNYLREIFHPAVGFIAAWISVTVGFSAPTALVALTFGAYMKAAVDWVDPQFAAIGLIVITTGLHMVSHRSSGSFHASFTYLKVALIVVFCVAVLALTDTPQSVSYWPRPGDWQLFAGAGFAVSLIFVNYAYLGWNATNYVSEEFNHPSKTISHALVIGTLMVLGVYLLLNFTFLYAAPISALEGQEEIGHITATFAFGEDGAMLMSILIAFFLISTLSGLILAGPRVLSRVGDDYTALSWLARKNKREMPSNAILVQSVLAVAIILTGTFDSILVTASLALSPSLFATVLACMWLRHKTGSTNAYRMPFYPLPPIIFLVVTGWMMIYVAWSRWIEGVIAIAMIGVGLILYLILTWLQSRRIHTDGDASVSP